MSEQSPIDLDQETSPIDPESPKYVRLLANLQGNILKSHGRHHAVNLFLTFDDGTGEIDPGKIDKIRRWISDFTARYVTSALRQHYETKEFKVNHITGRLFAGFYLSAEGYKALGFGADELEKFEEENLNDEIPDDVDNSPADIDVSFREGMAAGSLELKDLPPHQWEDNFRNNRIDALVLLADNEIDRLRDVTYLVSRRFEDLGVSFFRQDGEVLRDEASKEPIEHFGFRDGISQPVFIQADVDEARGENFKDWDPFAPLKLVLVPDPLIAEDDCFGSYLVYRKLEQNVKGFNEEKAKLIEKLSLKDENQERAGALIVGRFRNGTPVMLFDKEQNAKSTNLNNFNYSEADEETSTSNKCPYHAHIRRMNPRGETETPVNLEKELMRRIVRRGITYGERIDKSVEPTENVGLLFLCFQRSIPKQFGFIQTIWANTSAFLGKETSGLDPIIGRNESIQAGSPERSQKWCPVWGSSEAAERFEFKSFVTLKGGEYFFAPSLPFLRSLAEKKT